MIVALRRNKGDAQTDAKGMMRPSTLGAKKANTLTGRVDPSSSSSSFNSHTTERQKDPSLQTCNSRGRKRPT